MGMHTLNIHINGVAPLLLHAGTTIDVLHPAAKLMKSFSKKKTKTDEDHESISRTEWFAGLYLDQPDALVIKNGEISVKPGARIIIPAANIDAVLVAGAKKLRLGADAKGGLFCDGDSPLVFPGEQDPNVMWAKGIHVHRAAVRVQANRVMRHRPYFKEWGLVARINYDDSVFNPETVGQVLEYAGRCGIGDWRPQHGRFVVEKIQEA